MRKSQADIIRSTGHDQSELIQNILHLHADGQAIEVDCTYSKGNFYDNTGIERPTHCFDLHPQFSYVRKANANNLPLPDESVSVLMFDPPFLSDAGYTGENKGKISLRFGTVGKELQELWQWYAQCLKEFARVLKPNGIVIFKCQDVVSGGKQYFSHCEVMMQALQAGFYPKDLFVLLSDSRPIGRHKTQQHARKYHSYFWVFQKRTCLVTYTDNYEHRKNKRRKKRKIQNRLQ